MILWQCIIIKKKLVIVSFRLKIDLKIQIRYLWSKIFAKNLKDYSDYSDLNDYSSFNRITITI